MKFVVAPMGSAGDVHPLVGVGKSLEARGHDVVMVVLAGMSGSSERAGLRTIRVGNEQQFEAILHDPDLWHPRRAFGLIAQWIPLVAREMMAALGPELDGKETVMVAGGLAFGARALGEARGVPVVTMQLQPMVFMSAQEMPVMVAGGEWMRGMPQWARRMFFRMVNWQIDRLLRKSVNEIQREAGATGKVKGIFREWWHSPDGVVGLFPDWFAAKASDWPKQAVTTRFVLYDKGQVRAADPQLEAFLAGGGGGSG
ncbi:MAG: glycosyltransferase, partial [Phycisphaerales bacterium]|nr:glycosyltransferase [Phycisphaerales bacterium]